MDIVTKIFSSFLHLWKKMNFLLGAGHWPWGEVQGVDDGCEGAEDTAEGCLYFIHRATKSASDGFRTTQGGSGWQR